MRRIAILLGFTSLLLLALSAPAAADEIGGGCTATINGRDVADITKSNPLELPEGAMTVEVSGSVPPSALAAPPSQVTTTLDIVVAGAGYLPGIHETATGHSYSGSAEIPSWVRNLVAGLWKFDAVATGTPGSWRCSASIYLKVGGPLTVATGIGAVAAVAGAALASPVQSLSSPGRAPRPNQHRDSMLDRVFDGVALAATVAIAWVLLGILEVV
jgi:hypothetical protein